MVTSNYMAIVGQEEIICVWEEGAEMVQVAQALVAVSFEAVVY